VNAPDQHLRTTNWPGNRCCYLPPANNTTRTATLGVPVITPYHRWHSVQSLGQWSPARQTCLCYRRRTRGHHVGRLSSKTAGEICSQGRHPVIATVDNPRSHQRFDRCLSRSSGAALFANARSDAKPPCSTPSCSWPRSDLREACSRSQLTTTHTLCQRAHQIHSAPPVRGARRKRHRSRWSRRRNLARCK
jgi:hypothetical protein